MVFPQNIHIHTYTNTQMSSSSTSLFRYTAHHPQHQLEESENKIHSGKIRTNRIYFKGKEATKFTDWVKHNSLNGSVVF